jgi:hypothetical protein
MADKIVIIKNSADRDLEIGPKDGSVTLASVVVQGPVGPPGLPGVNGLIAGIITPGTYGGGTNVVQSLTVDTFGRVTGITIGVAVPSQTGNSGKFLKTDGSTPSWALIPNSSLVNSSLTVTAGTGLSGGGSVALGGLITLSLPAVGPGAGGYGGGGNVIGSLTLDAQGRVTAVTAGSVDLTPYALDAAVVHKAGIETITGAKTTTSLFTFLQDGLGNEEDIGSTLTSGAVLLNSTAATDIGTTQDAPLLEFRGQVWNVDAVSETRSAWIGASANGPAGEGAQLYFHVQRSDGQPYNVLRMYYLSDIGGLGSGAEIASAGGANLSFYGTSIFRGSAAQFTSGLNARNVATNFYAAVNFWDPSETFVVAHADVTGLWFDNGVAQFQDGAAASVSLSNSGAIRYNDTTKTFQFSADTSAWADFAADSLVVHKTGDETVAGVKTFSDGIITPSVSGDTSDLTLTGNAQINFWTNNGAVLHVNDNELLPDGDEGLALGNISTRFSSVASSVITAGAATLILSNSIVDGVAAVGTIINSTNALTTSGAKLLSIRNGDVEKFSFDVGQFGYPQIRTSTSQMAWFTTNTTGWLVNSSTQVLLFLNGGQAINFTSSGISPNADNTYALGGTSNRWSEVDTLAVKSGASALTMTSGVADGVSAIGFKQWVTTNLVNTGSKLWSLGNNNAEVIYFGQPAGAGVWEFRSAGNNFGLRNASSNGIYTTSSTIDLYGGGVARMSVSGGAAYPFIDNSISSGTTANRWTNVFGKAITSYFVQGDAIRNTVADGVVLQNTNIAIANVTGDDGQAYSPATHYIAQGYKTNATAGPQTVEWRIFNRPVQGTANPTTNLVVQHQINGGGWLESFMLDGTYIRLPRASAVGGGIFDSAGNNGIFIGNGNVNFYAGGTDNVSITNTEMYPVTDNARTLGDSTHRWSTTYTIGVNSGTSDLTLTPNTSVVIPSGKRLIVGAASGAGTIADFVDNSAGTVPRINVNTTATDGQYVGYQFSSGLTFKGGFFRLKSTDEISLWNTTQVIKWDTSGNATPNADNANDMGASGTRYRTFYGVAHKSGASAMSLTSNVSAGGSRAGIVIVDSNNNLGTDKFLSLQNTANGERMYFADGIIKSWAGGLAVQAVNQVDIQFTGGSAYAARLDSSGFYNVNGDNVLTNGASGHRWSTTYSLAVNSGASTLSLTSDVADGASAVGLIVNNTTALSNAGAKAVSFRNGGTERAFIAMDTVVPGSLVFQQPSTTYLGFFDSSFNGFKIQAGWTYVRAGGVDIWVSKSSGVEPTTDNASVNGTSTARWSSVGTLAITSGAGDLTLTPNAKVTIATGKFLTAATSAVVPPTITWTAPTLAGFWADEGSGTYYSPGYYKDAMGWVRLRGAIKSGGSNTTAFTLPTGYRPTKAILNVARGASGISEIRVNADGTVVPTVITGGTGIISLENITFYAEA